MKPYTRKRPQRIRRTLGTTILLSIKPEYADAILSGTKSVEFRKGAFPKHIEVALIYSLNPVRKIVGWFRVKSTVTMSPAAAWKKYHRHGGLGKEDFDCYYTGAKDAVCLEIGKSNRIDSPVNPYAVIKGFKSPQSFRYVKIPDDNGLIVGIGAPIDLQVY